MVSVTPKSFVATSLVVALVVATAPAFAAPAPSPATAGLTGTVYASDVATPLAGATVVATDAHGVKLASQPTRADGAFSIPAVAPGRNALTLETSEGSFVVATPVTLAPGETRTVRLALKAGGKKGSSASTKGGTGSGWSGGAIGGMTAVIIGFVAAGVIAADHASNDNTPVASGSQPPPSDK